VLPRSSRLMVEGDRFIAAAIFRIESRGPVQILQLLTLEQAQVARVDQLLDPVEIDSSADRSGGAWWRHAG
jgi:hypothetical protein